MPSTFSGNKNYELQATGEHVNIWGAVLNQNWQLVDANLAGVLPVAITSSDVTLTQAQAGNLSYTVTGTLTGDRSLIFPTDGGFYIINNQTTGAFSLTVKMAAGATVVVPQGEISLVYSTGSNMYAVASTGALILTGAGAPTLAAPDESVYYDTTAIQFYVRIGGSWVAATPSYSVKTANTVLAGPATGSPATPAYRALVSDDIPLATTSLKGGVLLGSATPAAIGTAAVGTSTAMARQDHVHAAAAVNVTNTPAGSIAATNVQAAINELDTEKQPLDPTLTALAAYNTNGLMTQTAADTFTGRTVTGTANQITVTNGNGVAGNPTLSLPADVVIPTVITTPNTGLHILDTDASHDLILAAGSNLTADRTLTVTTGDADRTFALGGDLVTNGAVNISAFAATFLDDADAATVRATLGAVSSSGQAALSGTYVYGHSSALTLASRIPMQQLLGTATTASLAIGRWIADVTAPVVVFAKSRGASVGAVGAVASGDTLGDLTFCGDDGTNLNTISATLRVEVAGAVSSGVVPTRILFQTTNNAGVRSEAARFTQDNDFQISGSTVITGARLHRLRVLTIATLSSVTPAQGDLVYVSDMSGGAGGFCVYLGTVWRGVTPGASIFPNDSNFTLTYLTSAPYIFHTGTLTANRTVTLSTTNVPSGATYRITRTGAGAFNLSVGGLKNLTTDTWCDVALVGGSWALSAYGSL